MDSNEDVRCPACGGSITIDRNAEAEIPVYVDGYVIPMRRAAIVAFCNQCEWCHEIAHRFLGKIEK